MVNNRGLTLIEVIIGFSLIILLSLAGANIYLSTQRFFNSTLQRSNLQMQSAWLIEDMVSKIRWGFSADVSTPGRIDVEVDSTDPSDPTLPPTPSTTVVFRYEQSGDEIRYIPDISDTATYTVLVRGLPANALSFSKDSTFDLERVTITLTASYAQPTVAVRTTVALRYSAVD